MFIIIVFWLGIVRPSGLPSSVPALLLSILTPPFLSYSSVSSTYFILAVPILNGSFFFRETTWSNLIGRSVACQKQTIIIITLKVVRILRSERRLWNKHKMLRWNKQWIRVKTWNSMKFHVPLIYQYTECTTVNKIWYYVTTFINILSFCDCMTVIVSYMVVAISVDCYCETESTRFITRGIRSANSNSNSVLFLKPMA